MRSSRVPSQLLLGAAFAVSACAGTPRAAAPSAAATARTLPVTASPAPPDTPPAPTAVAPILPLSPMPVAPVPSPESKVATRKTDPAWATCARQRRGTGKDVSADVTATAQECRLPTKMKPVSEVQTGKQADRDQPQTFPLDAKAGHCYRVYARGGDGIADWNVVVVDSAGVMLGQSSTEEASAVVLDDGAVCFGKDDKANVVVSVGMGSGAYALQIWED